MAHKHPVIDADKHFIIDPISRDIQNDSGKLVLVQNDHNSERFTFEIPRYVDGHDMSLCNVVQIHYNNKDTTGRYQNSDIYVVDDLTAVTAEEGDQEDTVTGSWLISMNATMFNGTLEFIVRFACVSNNGTIEYQWFSNIYSMIRVLPGIYNVDVVTNFDDKDILTAWKQEILDYAMPQFTDLVRNANATLDELNKQIVQTVFWLNESTGELEYSSPNYVFTINVETGNLEWEVVS